MTRRAVPTRPLGIVLTVLLVLPSAQASGVGVLSPVPTAEIQGGPHDRLGTTVDVDRDLAIATSLEYPGYVTVHERDGNTWHEATRLDARRTRPLVGAALHDGEVGTVTSGEYGTRLRIHERGDGGWAVTGSLDLDHVEDVRVGPVDVSSQVLAFGRPRAGDEAGQVVAWLRGVGTCTFDGDRDGDRMGIAVDVQGRRVLATERGQQTQAVHVLRVEADPWDDCRFVHRTTLPAPSDGTGTADAACDLHADPASWALEGTIRPHYIAQSGDTIAVATTHGLGPVRIYTLGDDGWRCEQAIPTASELYPEEIALDGDRLAVHLEATADDDRVHIYERHRTVEGPVWTRTQAVRALDVEVPRPVGPSFGEGLALSGGNLIVGAPEATLDEEGRAYIHDLREAGLPDGDVDDDGVPAPEDNCPTDPNPAQTDEDGFVLGDACDPAADDRVLFEDGFDDGEVDLVNWTTGGNVDEDDGCGTASGPRALHGRHGGSATLHVPYYAASGTLEFDIRLGSGPSWTDPGCHGPTPTVTLRTWELHDPDDAGRTLATFEGDAATEWTHVTIDLPGTGGSIAQLTWDGGAGGDGDWAIDNVVVRSDAEDVVTGAVEGGGATLDGWTWL